MSGGAIETTTHLVGPCLCVRLLIALHSWFVLRAHCLPFKSISTSLPKRGNTEAFCVYPGRLRLSLCHLYKDGMVDRTFQTAAPMLFVRVCECLL